MFAEPVEYDVDILRDVIKGLGNNQDTLIEILASRTGPLVLAIKNFNKTKFNKDL